MMRGYNRSERRARETGAFWGAVVGFVMGAMVTAIIAERVAAEAIGDRFLDCDMHDCGEDH